MAITNARDVFLRELPSGRFGFSGHVPMSLALERKDGKPLTKQDIRNVHIAGPTIAKCKPKSWETREAALAALVRCEEISFQRR